MKSSKLNHEISIPYDSKLIPKLINIRRLSELYTSYSEPNYIILSTFGRNFRITESMYDIICSVDGEHSLEELAVTIREKKNLDVTPETLWELFMVEFIPRSLIIFKGREFPVSGAKTKSFSSSLRITIIPFNVQLIISKIFSKFTSLPISLAFIGGFFGFSLTGTIPVINSTVQNDFLFIFLLIVLGLMIHEFGHSSAAIHGGIQPGSIKLRFLLWFPVLSIDVNDGWILNRKKRIELDLGGIGIQSGYGMLLLFLSDLTQSSSLYIASSVTFSIVLINILPFPAFDGYWLLTDVLGIPNLKRAALTLFWQDISMKNNKNNAWGSISRSVKIFLYLYALFTIFTVILVIISLSQIIHLFITLLINLPNFIRQIEMSLIERRFIDFIYEVFSVIFSLALCFGFIALIIQAILYIKSEIIPKLKPGVVITKIRNNDLKND